MPHCLRLALSREFTANNAWLVSSEELAKGKGQHRTDTSQQSRRVKQVRERFSIRTHGSRFEQTLPLFSALFAVSDEQRPDWLKNCKDRFRIQRTVGRRRFGATAPATGRMVTSESQLRCLATPKRRLNCTSWVQALAFSGTQRPF